MNYCVNFTKEERKNIETEISGKQYRPSFLIKAKKSQNVILIENKTEKAIQNLNIVHESSKLTNSITNPTLKAMKRYEKYN